MKIHFFLLLTLLISTDFYAMDGTVALLGEKKETADWSELASKLVAEYEIPIVLGSTLGLTGAVSLYKQDLRPFKIGCVFAGSYLGYAFFIKNQNDDESIQRINELKKTFGEFRDDIKSVQQNVIDIKVAVGDVQTDVMKIQSTVGEIESSITASTKASEQTQKDYEATNHLLAELITDGKKLNQNIKELQDKQDKIGKDFSETHAAIRTTDTENSDLILAALKSAYSEPTSITDSTPAFYSSNATRSTITASK